MPTGFITENAPAKVNLALHVTGQREDGYHLLDSLVVFTQFGDRVSLAASKGDRFAIKGAFASALADSEPANNLVLRARDLFLSLHQNSSPVSITLEKNLPIASGIGGGSSDAAATLRGLAKLYGIKTNEHALVRSALALGADVPMCLASRSLLARGIGEEIEYADGLPQLFMVLVNPSVEVSTPTIFRELKVRTNPPLPALSGNLSFMGLIEWLRGTRNDLESPAIIAAPAINTALSALRNQNSALARMSGSGATCFGLFGTETEANKAANAIASAQPSWFVKATKTLERTASNATP